MRLMQALTEKSKPYGAGVQLAAFHALFYWGRIEDVFAVMGDSDSECLDQTLKP